MAHQPHRGGWDQDSNSRQQQV